MDNTDNSQWNTQHDGKRCPINDTGNKGKPFALASNDPLWADGSINKAIKSQMDLDGIVFEPSDAVDGAAGTLSFYNLLKYVNPSLLYGFNGNAKGRRVQSLLSFRGYPTATVVYSMVHDSFCDNCNRLLWDGSDSGSNLDSYWNVKFQVTVPHAVDYDIFCDVKFNAISTNTYNRCRMKIKAGETQASEVADYYTISTFLPLTNNEAWFSAKQVFGKNSVSMIDWSFNYDSTLTHKDGDAFLLVDNGGTCPPVTWYFNEGIANIFEATNAGNTCNANGISEIYDNPSTARPYLVAPSIANQGDNTIGTNLNQEPNIGDEVRLGYIETNTPPCFNDVVVSTLSGTKYYVTGIYETSFNFKVSEIFKVVDGILIDRVLVTSNAPPC